MWEIFLRTALRARCSFVLLVSEVLSSLTCSHFLLWVWNAYISVASFLFPSLLSRLDLLFWFDLLSVCWTSQLCRAWVWQHQRNSGSNGRSLLLQGQRKNTGAEPGYLPWLLLGCLKCVALLLLSVHRLSDWHPSLCSLLHVCLLSLSVQGELWLRLERKVEFTVLSGKRTD